MFHRRDTQALDRRQFRGDDLSRKLVVSPRHDPALEGRDRFRFGKVWVADRAASEQPNSARWQQGRLALGELYGVLSPRTEIHSTAKDDRFVAGPIARLSDV